MHTVHNGNTEILEIKLTLLTITVYNIILYSYLPTYLPCPINIVQSVRIVCSGEIYTFLKYFEDARCDHIIYFNNIIIQYNVGRVLLLPLYINVYI